MEGSTALWMYRHADNAGTWLFHCHIEPHLTAGMISRYRVLDEPVKSTY